MSSCDLYAKARNNDLSLEPPSALEFSTYCTAHFSHSRFAEKKTENNKAIKKSTKTNFLQALEIGDGDGEDDSCLMNCITRVDIPGVVSALLSGEQVQSFLSNQLIFTGC